MENKELQELFAAKRTTEANRRRQEELRQQLEAAAAPTAQGKTRRLWPVWAAGIAASIALVLLTMPGLFRRAGEQPVLMAEAGKTIEAIDTIEAIETIETIETINPKPAKTFHSTAAVLAAAEEAPLPEPETKETEAVEEPATATFEAPAIELADNATPEPPASNAPRIHRRTSTSMVNSSNIETVQPMPSDFQNFLASAFGTETDTPFNLTTINL
ncbi:MAG: hypothetical protein II849_10255 [Bacteroidales bacterium]|nr:hypothetical protein [Bacteroidales bacterium]